MSLEPISLGIMAYQSRALPWSAQRCINWYAETAPPTAKAKTTIALLPRPGLGLFSTIAGKCRGNLVVNDVLYTVYGATFYSVSSAGVATTRGTITGGDGPISIASNGPQITIVDSPNAWVYTVASNAFTQLTGGGWPGSAHVSQLGGYFVHTLPGSTGEFFLSNLDDGTAFNALNYATAESDADALLMTFADHGELWLFGELSIEVWVVTGAVAFPMAPIQSGKIQRGLAAKYSPARQDNALYWIGDDFCVYRANGYVPVRVSTHPIENAITDAAVSISNVIGCAYTQDGHSFYQITLPGSWTFVLDIATGLWAERQTFGANYWKANFIVANYGKILAGHESGNIYTLTTGKYTDNGASIRFETTSPNIFANANKLGMNRLQVDMQAGVGLTTGQGSDPQIMVTWSDDGGLTWSNEHWRSMGAHGNRKARAIWRRLGKFYSRIIKIAITDPVKPVLTGAYADMEEVPS